MAYVTPLDLPTFNLSPLLPTPPLPPNWMERYQNTLMSQSIYKLFPVDPITAEFNTIADLLSHVTVSNVEQIVNPGVWLRFVNTRKDMIKSKSDDAEILAQLYMTEEEMANKYYYSLNFEKHPTVAAVPYNDNIALLFHCTRSETNIEQILIHGLDERLCKVSGLLGKGIYFSDKPSKAMSYDGCKGTIFMCAVILGDCLFLEQPLEPTIVAMNRVREPNKWLHQKRNFNDLFFDSTIGNPSNNSNELVIYNRYQCYPLYKINYTKRLFSAQSSVDVQLYSESRKWLPPFCWTAGLNENLPMPVPYQSVLDSWPFYAKTIFAKMGA